MNSQLQTALSFFVCTYIVCTFIASFILGVSFTARHDSRKLKWFQVLVCMFNLEYFLFVFVPQVQNHYFYNDVYQSIKNGAVIRNIPQLFFLVTIITILLINASTTSLAVVTVATSGTMIPFIIAMNMSLLRV